MNQLLIGSGDWHWAGWTTVDADPNSGAHVIAAVPPLPDSVKAQTYTHIIASHFIEHLYRWDALTLVQECYAVLETGGVLELEQPDLAYCCKVLAGVIEPPPGRSWEQFSLWGIFGRPELDPLMAHKHGYTPQTLTDLVVEAGFARENVTISAGRFHEPERDFTLRAVK
jgi:hypothetical protein